ncbi:hypothetical protein IWX90DRAFT_486864 [Phyllosticta citrichinensis]|uniref:Uncharacterized protein n=1 Tax=Phyllosticta citrichinensis TaxID=1130410 RepID=A0ABR1XUQ4_9PEZI
MGKPLLLGVRDVVTQWFVKKEAEQLMTGRRMQSAREREEEERQHEEETRQADQGRPPPGQDLAVVWKPFMTLMMNWGEGRDEADEAGRATSNHANVTPSISSKRQTLHPHHHAHTSLPSSSPSPSPSPRLIPHLLTLIPLLLFVTSIETSLRLARLSAINDISSIGQLIPFIIGLASFAASCREVLLVVYRRRHPDWRYWAWENV